MSYNLVTFDVDAMADKDFTFGGYPIEEWHLNGDHMAITVKGLTGTVDQLEDWLFHHYSDPYRKYYFGLGDKLSEIVRDGDQVKIACLKEDYVGFKLKLNKFIHAVNKSGYRSRK